MTKAFRYLVSQKLSNAQIEAIIEEYARGLSASEVMERAARSPGRSRSANTVFDIFALVRERLTEIGFYPSPQAFFDYWTHDPKAKFFANSQTMRAIFVQAAELRGFSERTAKHHIAELIFRAEHPDIDPLLLKRDIILAIKITGPLNRPPQNLDVWRSRGHIVMLNRQIAELRARMSANPEGHKRIIAQMELAIADEGRLYRRSLRALAKTGD